ncbi:hypothetical protein ABGB12_30340 [Actinocorallia sp. B10E7]|uniref:hypothetical protein n=1 Tax=Actinocorallia sp. B10E7 TaxID=3153558 RepID=UPI00325D0DBE
MGSTPNYSWQYPALTDPPNVPQHLQTLADAIDTTVKGIDTRIDELITPPYASLSNNGGATVENNTSTLIYWDREYADSANGHSDTVNNTRYTAQRTGRYLANATLAGTLLAPGPVQFFFRITSGSGTTSPIDLWGAALNANAGAFAVNITRMPWLQVGDYLQIYALQTTGQPMYLSSTTGLNGGCMWEVTWLGNT